MSRFLQGLKLTRERVVIQRVLIRRLDQLTAEERRFLSSDKKFESVLGPPRIRSPFDNPQRVLKATAIPAASVASFSDKGSGSTESFEQPKKQVLTEQKRDDDIPRKAPVHQAEPVVAAAASSGSQNSLWNRINEKIGYKIDDSIPEEEKKKIKVARNTFFGSVFVFGGLFVGFVWFCFHYGKAPRDEQGNALTDEFTGQSFAWFYRILNSFKLWRDYVVEPSREVLLPDPLPYPYHQPKYTLVIEMKNILVAPEWTYKTGYRFKKRPALDYFLDVVGYPNFEVVIYTSESSMTAPSVVENMDPKQRIMYKLYRDCTKYMNGHHVKDLSKLNRDLSRVIYIDFDPKSFQLNPDNVLRVPKWEGNMDDTALVDLAELLKTVHLSDVDDVRPVLQYYSQFDDPMKEFRRRAQYLAELEDKKHEDDQNQSALKRYADTGQMPPKLRFIFFLLIIFCLTNALAQWRVRQRSHQLTAMSTDDLRTLCSLTNMDLFKQLLKPILVERIVETTGHEQVAQFLKSTSEKFGFTTEWDIFQDNTPYGQKTFKNLIATFDPLVPRRLVLACHYDSKIIPGQKFLAATDSAVPCAILLDVARTLGPLLHLRSNKQITLQLIFLDGEEAFVNWSATDSVYGARHLSDLWSKKWYPSTSGSSFELSKEIDRIDVFMLLDLLGTPNPRITSTYGHGTTELFQELPKIEKALKSLSCLKSKPYAFQSGTSYQAVEDDHIPFMEKGVPIMHLISVPFPRVWHTPHDNEKALDFDTIENLNSVVRVFVARYLGITPSSGK